MDQMTSKGTVQVSMPANGAANRSAGAAKGTGGAALKVENFWGGEDLGRTRVAARTPSARAGARARGKPKGRDAPTPGTSAGRYDARGIRGG